MQASCKLIETPRPPPPYYVDALGLSLTVTVPDETKHQVIPRWQRWFPWPAAPPALLLGASEL